MGIIIDGTYTTQQGIDVPAAYVSFALNTFSIQPFSENFNKKYQLRCGYDLFASAVARDRGLEPLERGSVVAFTANVYAPYVPLYDALKVVFPESTDDV
jgi:hypothetical protein